MVIPGRPPRTKTSRWFNAQALTSTKTSLASIVGSGTFAYSSTSGPPCCLKIVAFTVLRGCLGNSALSLLTRVVGRTCEWARLDVMESHVHANFTPLVKFFRGNVAYHRETASVWLQVLSDGHDIARDRAKGFH